MQLPKNSIGPTDIIAWRECPRRMSHGMRRHTGPEAPESGSYATNYGTAMHEALSCINQGGTDDDAIAAAFRAAPIDPAGLSRLRTDIETFRRRSMPGIKPLFVEKELRVPLLTHGGTTIYFRGRIDFIGEREDQPGQWVHVDYKSSQHPKSQREVNEDVQLWAYNWLIHEFFPECDHLDQYLDQLSFGRLPTKKSDEQRELMGDWLRGQVTVILADESWQPDGLLAPQLNEFCGTCSIAASCPIVDRLLPFAKSIVQQRPADEEPGGGDALEGHGQGDALEEYVERIDDVAKARKMLEQYERQVKATLKMLPPERREALGYTMAKRSGMQWTDEALKATHHLLGDQFYDVISLSKQVAEGVLDGELLAAVLDIGEPVTTQYLRKKKG